MEIQHLVLPTHMQYMMPNSTLVEGECLKELTVVVYT